MRCNHERKINIEITKDEVINVLRNTCKAKTDKYLPNYDPVGFTFNETGSLILIWEEKIDFDEINSSVQQRFIEMDKEQI